MSDNKGIPFNLLTEEEVEKLFEAEMPSSGILNGGVTLPGNVVPGAPQVNIEDDQWPEKPMGTFHYADGSSAPVYPKLELGLGLNMVDEKGNPTCYPAGTCGICDQCRATRVARAYFGGLTNRAMMMPSAVRGHDIGWNPYLMQQAVRLGGGLRRGELFFQQSPYLYSRPVNKGIGRNGIIYNMEETWGDLVDKLIKVNSLYGLDYIAKLTNIPQLHHQISDVEVDGDGKVFVSLMSNPFNVGTLGHVDYPHARTGLNSVFTVDTGGIWVGGKVVHVFPDKLRKHYFALGGDHLGDSMLRNGRYGANPHSYPAIKPIKQKREQWAQDAVDKMVVNNYLDKEHGGVIPYTKLVAGTLVSSAKRAQKNKGLNKEGVTLKDLFGKHS